MKLNPDNNTSHNDYINASYVDVSFFRTPFHSGHPFVQDTLSFRTPFRSGHPFVQDTLSFRTPFHSGHPFIQDTL